MSIKALRVAVVGHTNTGKTSLLRTLLRDETFGDVAHQAATTRHVEEATIRGNHQVWLYLYDTPGFEDASGVYDCIRTYSDENVSGVKRLALFLAHPDATARFEQEAKVIRQLANVDAILYVIDAREPVLEAYEDELWLLAASGKPVLPVFNFIRDGDFQPWHQVLAERGLHSRVAFDTVAFDFEGEIKLWQHLQILLNDPPALQQLINMRRNDWQQLNEQAYLLAAEWLIDVAAYRVAVTQNETDEIVAQTMYDTVWQQEIKHYQKISALYRFYREMTPMSGHSHQRAGQLSPLDWNEWASSAGVMTASASAGAVVGLGVDTALLGTSMGLGTAVGALLGVLSASQQRLRDQWHGVHYLYVDDEVLNTLVTRLLMLLTTLRTRGHAATGQIHVQATLAAVPNLSVWLNQARHRPKWSRLNPEYAASARSVKEVRQQLAADLAQYFAAATQAT